jgi:anti-sigma B factor antagonist
MSATPSPISELNLETTKSPEETIIRRTGKITSGSSGVLQTTVRGLFPETKCVVLDLTNVSYMDSSGLGVIAGLFFSAKRQNSRLKLINLNQRLQELFRISKLATVFEGHEDFLGYTPD